MKTLDELTLSNKKVLLRVDFNVPIDPEGKITDDTRIRESIPTIAMILEKGGIPVIMGHLGRPDGKPDPRLSLAPCAERLSQLIQKPVQFVPDCVGKKVEEQVSKLTPGTLLLLENVRFYSAEEKPSLDPSFAASLAKLGEVYIDDAFGSAHRAHSSIYEVPKFFPKNKGAGLLMAKEYTYFNQLFAHPDHPFFAIIGGGKISSKFTLLKALVKKVDQLFVGGGMAFTLLKAQGIGIGDSLYEENLLTEAKQFLSESGSKLVLPKDIVITDPSHKIKLIKTEDGIPDSWKGMDVGPETIKDWSQKLNRAATIFWNGPLGVYETPPFEKGTHELAKIMANLNAITVVGGGDSLAAINHLNLNDCFSHLSTGGGACLEFLEFGHLPGIDALKV